jgi:two-component sensor histidine kinase
VEQDNPTLNLNLKLNEQKILSLRIQDNGKGFAQNTESDTPGSFGLKMVRTLIKELKGKMDLQTENGTTYFLLIPIA